MADPSIPLGYVFIYFYGLERRVLVDQIDYVPIANEILRLLEIYSHSRSFCRYGTSLLWSTIWLGLTSSSIPGQIIEKALLTQGWSEETLAICLACFESLQATLPKPLLYRLAQNDVRSPRSVVVKRHPDLHVEAFSKRIDQKFPNGFRLKAAKRLRRLEYFTASSTLGRLHDSGGPLADQRIPNVLGLPSQFQPLVDLWTQTNEDLKAYDRAHKKAGEGEFTAGMYEALPEHLREGDHPHFDAWYQVMDRSVTEDG